MYHSENMKTLNKFSCQIVEKRSLSSLLRLLAVLNTVTGNSAPHQASRLERQAFSINLTIRFLGLCLHTNMKTLNKFSCQIVEKRSLSSLLRLLAVLNTVTGNSAPHQASRLERQAFSINLTFRFLGLCLHTNMKTLKKFSCFLI